MTTQNSALVSFDFQGREVRVTVIDDEPWWVAVDVCASLDIKNVSDAMRKLDDDEHRTVPLSQVTPSIGSTESGLEQGRKVLIISEPGLYTLILRSRKESARTFRRWVVHEVLPAIRRTGRYAVNERSASDLPVDMHAFLREVSQVATEAAVTAAREAAREASLSFRETLDETRSAFKEAVAEMRDTFSETVRQLTSSPP